MLSRLKKTVVSDIMSLCDQREPLVSPEVIVQRLHYLCESTQIEGDIDTDELEKINQTIFQLRSLLTAESAKAIYEKIIVLEEIVAHHKTQTMRSITSKAQGRQQVSSYGKSRLAQSRFVYRQA